MSVGRYGLAAPILHRSWIILIQAVHGSSRSMF
jgi:hypothetical protein